MSLQIAVVDDDDGVLKTVIVVSNNMGWSCPRDIDPGHNRRNIFAI